MACLAAYSLLLLSRVWICKGRNLLCFQPVRQGKARQRPEGIYGLQRAFKKAGVQTIIMTLWNVSDFATKEFMTTFFVELANNGWKKREAFNETKRIVRKKYPEPYYWAGFVMLD